MNYRDFGEYVASYDEFADSLALTSRPFLKIERLLIASYARARTRRLTTCPRRVWFKGTESWWSRVTLPSGLNYCSERCCSERSWFPATPAVPPRQFCV